MDLECHICKKLTKPQDVGNLYDVCLTIHNHFAFKLVLKLNLFFFL